VSAATVADRRVHPATVVLRFIKELPSTILGLPAAFTIVRNAGLLEVLGFVGGIALVMLFFNWLAWHRFRYGLGDNEIVIESGILSRNRRSIPFDRIQDVDFEQRLLQRLFGLAKVRIETGGSAADEGVLDSVTLAEATRLRGTVRAGRIAAVTEMPEGEEGTAQPGGRTLFAMDFARVLRSGAYNFSLFYIAALFALLQQFDDWLPFDIYDASRWIGMAEARANRVSIATALLLLALALLLGVVTGIVRTVARDYGFRLVVEGRRLRRVRGLLTRTEAVIPVARVQLARVETGPFRRLSGWFALSFQTLSGAEERGAGGSQSVAPLATRQEMQAVLAEEGRLRLPEPGALARVSQRHLLRAALPGVLAPLLTILVGAWFEPRVLLLLALLPALAAVAVLDWLFHRYSLDGDLLFVARGFWRQQLWVIPLHSTQGLSLSRSPAQRLLGLATLSIDTAGAPVVNGARIVDLRHASARALYEELAALTASAKAAPRPES
jgi:putative membrane protein